MSLNLLIPTLLLIVVVVAVFSQTATPCLGADNLCPPSYDCDVASNTCLKSNSTCTDDFVGKGSCPQFKRAGFCDTNNARLITRWCAKTCGTCT